MIIIPDGKQLNCDLTLTFLGTSHGRTEKGRFCSSYAITVNKTTYLVDAGAPITGLLRNYDIPYETVKDIFITHMHTDHYIGLAEYISKMNEFPIYKDVLTTVHSPDPDKLSGIWKLFYDNAPYPNRVLFKSLNEGEFFNDKTVKVTAIKNDHLPQNSYSFLFETKGKRILFTGDLSADYHEYPAVLEKAGGKFDLILTEAAHDRLNKPEHIEKFIRSDTKALVITHRCTEKGRNDDGVMAEVIKKVSPHRAVILAEDGLEIKI